jgi:hypothetical protein
LAGRPRRDSSTARATRVKALVTDRYDRMRAAFRDGLARAMG